MESFAFQKAYSKQQTLEISLKSTSGKMDRVDILVLHLGIPSMKYNSIPWTLYTQQTQDSEDEEKRNWLETSGSMVRCWAFILPHIFQSWSRKTGKLGEIGTDKKQKPQQKTASSAKEPGESQERKPSIKINCSTPAKHYREKKKNCSPTHNHTNTDQVKSLEFLLSML